MALRVTESRSYKPLGISSNYRLIFPQGYILHFDFIIKSTYYYNKLYDVTMSACRGSHRYRNKLSSNFYIFRHIDVSRTEIRQCSPRPAILESLEHFP